MLYNTKRQQKQQSPILTLADQSPIMSESKILHPLSSSLKRYLNSDSKSFKAKELINASSLIEEWRLSSHK